LTLAACASQVHTGIPELRRGDRPPRIVVMPLDVELSQVTAGGLEEPQAEWTAAARRHMMVALEQEARARQVSLEAYDPTRGTPEDQETSRDLVKLHRAVGGAILVHRYAPEPRPLPSKEGRFDWGLGPEVAAIARSHDADYALFLFVRDRYATGGRVAAMVVGALLGVGVPGGSQIGFGSLADLRTGDIVWFRFLLRLTGDLRTAEAAAGTVKALLSEMPR
jgi:hypothetical protein